MAQKATREDIEGLETLVSSEKDVVTTKERPIRLVWFNIFVFILLHAGALYGLYLALTSAKLYTNIFACIMVPLTLLGITAGTHRLWAHRSYEAKLPLQILLLILGTMAWQNSVIWWVRNHRLHHKYSDTDADPHNSRRGFFFSHIGYLMCKKLPIAVSKGKEINIDDLLNNRAVMFQHKYFWYLAVPMTWGLPTWIPMYFWGETFQNAFFVACALRVVVSLHFMFLVNSAAHLYGQKPYDKNLQPGENKLVAFLVGGEGWHNFHHAFPWDYKNAEFGIYRYNLACGFIDLFASIGWAYNLKSTPPDMVRDRVKRTGDGTHSVWGWNDKDLTDKDRSVAILKHVQ